MAEALYRKWRPKTWGEVVGQDHVIRTLRNAVRGQRVAHAYLFAGSRGTGKTSTARVLAKAVNCLADSLADRPCNQCRHCQAVNEGRFLDLIEIDAASNTSVEDVRDLRDKINFSPNEGRYKVYIVDEVHMLSTAAFNALLKTLEEPPDHAIFVLATTEVHKIPATVLSRCQRHEFRRLPVATIKNYLHERVSAENLSVEEQALELIARQATGSLRDAISLLDQLSSTGDEVTLELAQMVLGTVAGEAVRDVVQAIMVSDASLGLTAINHALDGGADPRQFARQVVDYLRGLLMVKMGSPQLVDVPADSRVEMEKQVEALSLDELIAAISAFDQAALRSRAAWLPGLSLELALLEACQKEPQAGPKPAGGNPGGSQPGVDRSGKSSQPEPPPSRQVSSAPSETNADGLAFEDIQRNWSSLLKIVRRYDPRTQGLLNSSTALGIERGALLLGFRSDLLREKMEKEDNIACTLRAMEELFGKSLHIRCVLLGRTSKMGGAKEPTAMEEGGMVATAVRDFGAQVVDVKSTNPESSA